MDSSREITVVCMKWGTKYPSYYVNRLYGGVSRFMDRPFRFVCYTDDAEGIRDEVECFPLPSVSFERQLAEAQAVDPGGQWRKVTLFQPGEANLSGPCLFLDLDLVITGPLEALLDYAPGKFCVARRCFMRRSFSKRILLWIQAAFGKLSIDGYGAAVVFDPQAHRYVFDEFASSDIARVAESHPGEQEFTSRTAHRHGDLRHFPEEWVRSYAQRSLPKFPWNLLVSARGLEKDCRVLCFAGSLTMDQVSDGSLEAVGKLRFRNPPPIWLSEYWRE